MEPHGEHNRLGVQDEMLLRRAHSPSCASTMMGTMISDSKELLPGIPDDVTLNHISTKLPWRAFDILSSVSTTWRQAIRNRLIYDTRVRYQSLEKLVLHSHCSRNGDHEVLCLYSSRDERCYELPGIPGVNRGIPSSSQLISIDSKIYVLGKHIYVLDVAVERKWRKCAYRQSGRDILVCGVLDGKIYSFGTSTFGSEMYNPKTDAWYPIQHTTQLQQCSNYRVDKHGEELFVHSGMMHQSWNYYEYDVFHTGKLEWRLERPACSMARSSAKWGAVFMVEGKFYLMTSERIYVHDANLHYGVWKDLHSFVGFGQFSISAAEPNDPVFLDGELYVKMSGTVECPAKSQGFRGEKHEIVWNPISCGHRLKIWGKFAHPIQL